MQRLAINQLKPGMIIESPVLSSAGRILIDTGAVVTRSLIDEFINWSIDDVAIVHPAAGFQEIYAATLAEVETAFKRIRLFNEMPIAAFEEVASYLELLVDTSGIVGKLHSVKVHSEYTYKHSLNVAIIAGVLGNWLDYNAVARKELILAGLLHDIGKARIPLAILDKPGGLNKAEMARVREHPAEGFELVKTTAIPQAVKIGILQHHERLDGSGYPYCLKNDEIAQYGRILAIADMYDAMTSRRVYRAEMTAFGAMETIAEQMYDKLEPAVCLNFLANIRCSLAGRNVILTTGEQAKIALLHSDLRLKPMVRLENGTILDLNRITAVGIGKILED